MKKPLIFLCLIVCFTSFIFGQDLTRPAGIADFDGDGKANISVFRPSNGVWYVLKSKGEYTSTQWGIGTDYLVPSDYDGDGKIDIAVTRIDPFNPNVLRNAIWYILQSSDSRFTFEKFGEWGVYGGDVPLPADYDGDKKADLSIYNVGDSSRSEGFFQTRRSLSNSSILLRWGFTGDKRIAADFDGDGKTDFAVFRDGSFYRPTDATPLPTWYILQSSNGAVKIEHFGQAKDKLVAADYDGDGKDDVAVWRPSNGYWYWLSSRDGSFRAVQFGQDGDKPVPADYDGDGKTDIGVFRPSSGTWYLLKSTEGFSAVQFGFGDDIPIPNVFIQ